MSVELTCPNPECRAVLGFPDTAIDSIGECPRCQTKVLITRPVPVKRPTVLARRHTPWLKWGAVAAALMVCLGAATAGVIVYRQPIWNYWGFNTSHGTPPTPVVPDEDFSSDFASAHKLTLPAAQPLTQPGVIKSPGKTHMFTLTAPQTGTLMVHLTGADGATINGHVTVFDAQHKELARTDKDPAKNTHQLHLPVTEGETYFVQAARLASDTGPYSLHLRCFTDIGTAFDEAHLLVLSPNGHGELMSRIDPVGDEDIFRFVSPLTGKLTIRLQAVAPSKFDGSVYFYDDQRQLIDWDDDDGYAGGTWDSRLEVQVEQGKTYFLKAKAGPQANAEQKTGDYRLSFTPVPPGSDDHGSSYQTATALTLSPSGAGKITGKIETIDDQDMFRFQAPMTGKLTITLRTPLSSDLRGRMSLANEDRRYVERDDILTGTIWKGNVTGGGIYYLKVKSDYDRPAEERVGAYELTFEMAKRDDFGNTFLTAHPLTLSPLGTARQNGEIEEEGDKDMFRFRATVSGTMTIQTEKPISSSLDSYLILYDDNFKVLAEDDDGGESLNSLIRWDVVRDRTYYVEVSTKEALGDGKTGAYTLVITTQPGSPPKPAPNPFDNAKQLTLSPSGGIQTSGILATPTDKTMFQFRATVSGQMTILVEKKEVSSRLDCFVRVFDEDRVKIVEHDDIDYAKGILDSRAELDVMAGKLYYVEVSTEGTELEEKKTGAYTVTILTAPAGSK
ncbi:MAG: hypothetical protein ACK4RK_17790 [Gemmataceae bacterium]